MATTTPNYDINYDDERLVDVKTQEQTALTENEQLYGGMIENVDQYYTGLQEQSKEYADKQAQLQQENTDFAIEQINQQKDQAKKDYTKEQSGAYVDWQKQSNQYGAQAEQMASQGMAGSGYSESSQVGMYNTYQNRVAVARESLNKTMMNFDNNIQQAILQNNSALAEIYYNAHREQLELSLESFQYKNTLLIEQANKQQELKQFYSNEYQNVLNQMNTENAMAENVRQFNEQQALEREQMQKSYELQLAELAEKKRQFDEEMARLKKLDDEEAQRKAQELELQRRQVVAQEKEVQSKIDNLVIEKDPVVEDDPEAKIEKDPETKKQTTSNSNTFGNSASTMKKSDYYFSNGYQPQYINNKKLSKSGVTIGAVFGSSLGLPTSQNIWKAGAKYYVWDGSSRSYVDVTAKYHQWVYSGGRYDT